MDESAFGGQNIIGEDRIAYPKRDWICILGYVYLDLKSRRI